MSSPPLIEAHQTFFDLAFMRDRAEAAGLKGAHLIDAALDPENPEPPPPNALFDIAHYNRVRMRIGQNTPVNPVVHYLTEGHSSGLSINAFFDEAFYRLSADLTGASSLETVTHFLGALERLPAPFHPFINLDFIAGQQGQPVTDQLVRDILSGTIAPRQPHPLVDVEYMQTQSSTRIETLYDACVHYWTTGEDLSTHQLFDTNHYKQQFPDPTRIRHSVYHYLTSTKPNSPHPLFDPAYYRAQLKARGQAVPKRLLEHFVVTGQAEGLASSPFFDARHYQAQSGCETDALQHYLSGGFKYASPHPLVARQQLETFLRTFDQPDVPLAILLANQDPGVPLDLTPDINIPFLAKLRNDPAASPTALRGAYMKTGYSTGQRPNGLLSLPYIETQCRWFETQDSVSVTKYFAQGMHQRTRILLALGSMQDTKANRAWLALCQSQINTPGIEFVVLSAQPGPLSEAFCKVSHVWHLAEIPLSEQEPEGLASAVERFKASFGHNQPVVAWVDCDAGPTLLQALGQLETPIAAFGEDGFARMSPNELASMANLASKVMVSSPQFAAQLVQSCPELEPNIQTDFHTLIAPARVSETRRSRARAALGLGDDTLFIVSSGAPGLEHGVDLFGILAAQCIADDSFAPASRFHWCGPGRYFGNQPKFYGQMFGGRAQDKARFDMSDHDDPSQVLAAADVYVSIGRDACPPRDVALALAQGMPVVLMKGSAEADIFADAEGVHLFDAFDLNAAREILNEIARTKPSIPVQRAGKVDAGALGCDLAAFVTRVSQTNSEIAPTAALSVPDNDIARKLLIAVTDPDLLKTLAKWAGQDEETAPIELDLQHIRSTRCPVEINALAQKHACGTVVVRDAAIPLAQEDTARFDHMIWLADGRSAELRALYETGLAFDEIQTRDADQIEQMRKLNPKIADLMHVRSMGSA